MATNSKPQFVSSHHCFLFFYLYYHLDRTVCAVTGHGFSIEEASVHDIQLAFKQNQLTSRQLVEFYLKQIHRLNPILKGVMEVTQKHYTWLIRLTPSANQKQLDHSLGYTVFPFCSSRIILQPRTS